MKSTKKPRISLSEEDLRLVLEIQRLLEAKNKASVVRRALQLLRDSTPREGLREAYRRASLATRASLEFGELDHLTGEGIDP